VTTGDELGRSGRIADEGDGITQAGRCARVFEQDSRCAHQPIPVIHLEGAIHKNHVAGYDVITGNSHIRKGKRTATDAGDIQFRRGRCSIIGIPVVHMVAVLAGGNKNILAIVGGTAVSAGIVDDGWHGGIRL